MRRRELDLADFAPDWRGLRLDVDRVARPSLRPEVGDHRHMLIRQGRTPVLFVQFAQGYGNAEYHRAPGYRSPLQPTPVKLAYQLADPGSPAWYACWLHRFADLLAESPGPLHDGSWLLHRELLPPEPLRVLDTGPAGSFQWWEGGPHVLPLRALSPADAPRVSAYRRQARDGVLPPILLWYVSGLAGFVVLDGHDRLAAALAEGVRPPVLHLCRGGEDQRATNWLAGEIDRYTAAMRRPGVTTGTARQLGGALAATYRRAMLDMWRTRAWPVPGGRTGWRSAAAAARATSLLRPRVR
ncbi:hypothetical protein F0L68_37445 [Solihabitans fulvus]|uniref:Uncharacterized protein n=1 Tax=Solihabitans fulvus TaxID=1892852 RepID=A0A5B2WGV7_9PSEU|nr:hypothetical protein [Solihabitans fulvus]KAA2251373.1 hypothetical protein F0L68_37445 [Solihabitans fulvus]